MARRNWFSAVTQRRAEQAARTPMVASRDLPPLPRSPEPLSDEALVFARAAAAQAPRNPPNSEAMQLSIAEGADLRALLDRVRTADRRRIALDQAATARARLVEQLEAARAGTPLRLAGGTDCAPSRTDGQDDGLERAMQQALASALDMLGKLNRRPRAVD